MFDERVFPYSPQGGFRYFKGHFRTRWCLRHVFCGVMHHCVVRRSGSVPAKMPEPPGGSIVQARIHRNIAKQRLPGKPTDLRQFPDHSLPGAFFLGAKNHIENYATSETVWAQFVFWCGKFELLRLSQKRAGVKNTPAFILSYLPMLYKLSDGFASSVSACAVMNFRMIFTMPSSSFDAVT